MPFVNPDLQAKLVTYLDGLEKGAAKVGEFAEREIPETIREWLLWLAVERFTYAALCLLGVVIVAAIMRKLLKQCKGDEDVAVPVWLFGGTALCFGIFGTVHYGMAGAKVVIAPRVVIVEKVADLAGRK